MIGHSRRRRSILSPEGLSYTKVSRITIRWDYAYASGMLKQKFLKVMILFLYFIRVDNFIMTNMQSKDKSTGVLLMRK